ncbi:acyltransferase family protein [[Ruminococcus] lactaris]|uniref:acyltransferase family protein n=1 Tax=[Ruminococcus] lactaris TaxID=46228 RepID=UPI003522A222
MEKQTTQEIKGIAILIMIAHHFLVYDFGADFSNTWVGIGANFKICVGIYAVLSGYGYFFAKEKTVKYGLKKSWGLLQEYWITLFTIFIPLAIQGGWKVTPKNILINLFTLGPNLNWNAWYVHFFIFCMLVMPWVSKSFRFHPVLNIALALCVPFVLEAGIHVVFPNYQEITMLQVLFNCMLYFGVFLMGYLMAKYDIIRKMQFSWIRGLLMMIGAIGLRIVLRHINTFGFNTDAIYAPIFVLGAAKFFEGIQGKYTRVFDMLGKYSTGMWFFHAVFFATYVKDYFQPVMTAVKPLPLMYVWLVMLSFAGAVLFRKLLDGIKLVPRLVKELI